VKELRFFVQKGQDAEQFKNHDEELTVMRVEMEAKK
jgi:hypothetical protein